MRLSVLIPARNEEWLNLTVEDVLSNIEGDTDVIVVLDGAWPVVPLAHHPRLQVIKLPNSIGQRAATNLAARISNADYVMKLDAHCQVSPGFDVSLIEAAGIMGNNVCQIPAQYNLHAFDWICTAGHRVYQGPTPTNGCTWKPKKAKPEDPICGAKATREIVWRKRESRLTTSWRFDRDLHFQYWGQHQKDHQGQPIHDVMSCLGACWFVHRQHFFSLGGLDEDHGSWGQMGTELACKYWLSGGSLVVNKHAWFAHLFRTQGGDFSFPYPLSGEQQDKARKRSAWLWKQGNWPLAKYDLRWLIERFNPPGWKKEDLDGLSPMIKSEVVGSLHKEPLKLKAAVRGKPSIGAIWYTDHRADERILRASLDYLHTALPDGDIIRVGIKECDYVDQVLPNRERGILTMFEQILAGLEALDTDIAFLCEHDVLYHPSHFKYVPNLTDGNPRYCYNTHTWKVDVATGKAVTYVTKQTSGLVASRGLLVEHYTRRIERVKAEGFTRAMGFEPGSHARKERIDDIPSTSFLSEFPNIDLRHSKNLTPSRWAQDEFRDQRNCQGWKESTASEIPGWPELPAILEGLR